MTKQELKNLIKQVEGTNDLDHAEELYEKILNQPELIEYKSQKAIADIKWNRAQNLEEIANWYLSNIDLNEEGEEIAKKPLPIRAHTMQKMAIAEIIGAELLYTKKSDKQLAKSYLRDLQLELNQIEATIEGKTATIPALEEDANRTYDGPPTKKSRLGESPYILMPSAMHEETAADNPPQPITYPT